MTAMAIIIYILSSGIYGVGTQDIDADEAYCMAVNIYYEARGEPVQGQVAVGNVVLNRVKSRSYPNTICGVVKQAKYDPIKYTLIKDKCQFSWYCDGKSDKVNKERAFKQAVGISIELLTGRINDNTNGATHYFNPSKAQPYWANSMVHVATYDNHEFYKNN